MTVLEPTLAPVAPETETSRLVDALENLRAESLSERRNSRKFARPEVLDALLARGETYLRADPGRSERLGLLGVFLSGQIHEEGPWLNGFEAWVPPGVVRSGLLVGAARRLQGKLQEADSSFRQVGAFLCGRQEEAAYSRELGLLRWQQGRSCDAAALLAQGAELAAETDDARGEAACLALLGLLRREEPEPERRARARDPLLRALAGLPGGCHPVLALRARLELALGAAEEGEAERASDLLAEARRLAPSSPAPCLRGDLSLTLSWASAKLADLEGRPREAEQLLLPARQQLMAAGRLGDAALASLDLALFDAHRGHLDRAASLADQLACHFHGHPGLVYALQALADFEESLLLQPKEARGAHAVACRFLRQSLRAKGLAIEEPPYP